MRKVTYGGAISLDGYLAGSGEAMDWLRWSEDAASISAASWRGVDTMLMGRKTFEFAVRNKHPLGQAGIRTILFTSSLETAPAGVELVSGDAAEFVRELKDTAGGRIMVMGGGELGTSLLASGLVDEIGFNVHPILLGAGVPALPAFGCRLELRLEEATPIAGGCVFLRYHVLHAENATH